jgi:sortase A
MTLADVRKEPAAADRPASAPATAMPRFERARRRTPRLEARRFRRPALAVIAALVVGFVVSQLHDRIVSGFVYEHRQQRLAADFAVPAPERIVKPGEPIAILQSTDIELNEIVVEGDSVANLRGGPARRTGSAMPGEPGRTVILGHRRAYGGSFDRIDELVEGNTVVVQTRNSGPIVAYIVREVITDASAEDVPDPDEGVAQLVLVTSAGGWTGGGKVVVVASTLPVIDAPAELEALSLDASDSGSPFGKDALVANLAVAAAVLGWIGLRRRHTTRVVVALVVPTATFAAVSYLFVFDTLLSATR